MPGENTGNVGGGNTGQGADRIPTDVFNSLDDLIPDELKAIVEGDGEKKDPPPEPKEPKPIVREPEDKKEPPIDRGGDDLDEDIDLNAVDIDKLLAGDPDAIRKDDTEGEEDPAPFWHEDETYKQLLNKATRAGVSQEELDKIIIETSDKKVLDTSKYVEGIEKRNEDYARDIKIYKQELDRLRKLEKATMFDSLPETQETYGKAMASDITEMKKILDMEGSDFSVNQLLMAKDKAAFTDIVKDSDFSDDDLKRLTNHWRSYRETFFKYNNAKEEAQKDISKYLKTSISDKDAEVVLRNSLHDFLKSDGKYKYIHDAIMEGVDKHEDVSMVIANAKKNFLNTVKALSNPKDYVHNGQWLSGLAKFFLDSAHNQNIEKQYKSLSTQNKELEGKLLKVVKAYRKLAESGQGITGKRNGAVIIKDGKKVRDSDHDAEAFKAFLNNEVKVDEILGM